MSELPAGFQALPPEYQRVLLVAQDQHQIQIAPLQTLVGGWSGAMVFLVRVTYQANQQVEHLILKLDRKGKTTRSDELSRHVTAQSKSPAEFARDHFATLAFERVEADGAIAIFYSIAGQSLQSFRPLSSYGQQSQLETIFAATQHYLLSEWNPNPRFGMLHPRDLLEKWLGFRLEAGAPIETFLRQTCKVEPDRPGFLIQSSLYPNPLHYARARESWGNARPIDVILGLQHGDLNTNNILVKFSTDEKELSGYYLIDFALFKEEMPLFYDLRYLEMSYLILTMSQISFSKIVDLILQLANATGLDPRRVPIEMAGISAVITSARSSFDGWLRASHPSMYDDLWGQYWLAGVAAGLSYCHKVGLADEQRLAGLIYAAANLKSYLTAFSLPLPIEVEHLYSGGQFGISAVGKPFARKPHHNLPVPPTPFIGRTAHITALKELIQSSQVRLVTLLGPGGTGKTRLSLQVAQELLDDFPQGVFFVPLADDMDAAQFISRLAQQLDVQEDGRPLLEKVKDYLREKRMLLVLDNFERLVSEAPVVAELLVAAPQIKVITSSLIALKLHGEHEYPVPPLELPLSKSDWTVEELADNESVVLFVERARASSPKFGLTNDNASAVVGICRRLDGLPLALELAAARIKILTPQALLTRLDDRLKLLRGGARDLPSRHQTLQAMIDWSHDLLSEPERVLWRRLSIFNGGWTLEGAEAICADDSLPPSAVLELMSQLVDKSLVLAEEQDNTTRYRMLETIREYAWKKLNEADEFESLRDRHLSFFLRFAEQVESELQRGDETSMAQMEVEHDNVRSALDWSLKHQEGLEVAFKLAGATYWFWDLRGMWSEAKRWLEAILARPPELTPEIDSNRRADLLVKLGNVNFWLGNHTIAEEQFRVGFALTQAGSNPKLVSMALIGLCNVLTHKGAFSEARQFGIEALALARETGNRAEMAWAARRLSVVAYFQGRNAEAKELLKESLALSREVDDRSSIAACLALLGDVFAGEHDYPRAVSYLEQALEICRETGNQKGLAITLGDLGGVIHQMGDDRTAIHHLEEAIGIARQIGDRERVATVLCRLGDIAVQRTEITSAKRYYRQALTEARDILSSELTIAISVAALEARVSHFNQAVALLGWVRNQPAITVEFREQSQALLNELHEVLPEAEFNAALEAGPAMNINQVLQEILEESL